LADRQESLAISLIHGASGIGVPHKDAKQLSVIVSGLGFLVNRFFSAHDNSYDRGSSFPFDDEPVVHALMKAHLPVALGFDLWRLPLHGCDHGLVGQPGWS